MLLVHYIKKFLLSTQTNLASKLTFALSGALMLNIAFGLGFYLAEGEAQPDLTFSDAVWWSMVTMTTVGYGDFFPQTFIGRFFIAYPCFILGIGLIGYLLGMLAESLIELTTKKKKGQLKARMKNHIIICHCPSEAKILNIAKELRASPQYADRKICVVTEALKERPASFNNYNINFVKGNPSDELILEKAGVQHCHGVVILAKRPGDSTSDASSFTIGTIVEIIAKERQRPIRTVAEVINQKSDRLFARTEVDGAVVVEGLSDMMMVQEFLNPGIRKTFEQLLTNTSGSQLHRQPTKLIGKKIVEVQAAALQHSIELQIIGICRQKQQMLNPCKQTVIEKEDQLLVLAKKEQDYFTFEQDFINA